MGRHDEFVLRKSTPTSMARRSFWTPTLRIGLPVSNWPRGVRLRAERVVHSAGSQATRVPTSMRPGAMIRPPAKGFALTISAIVCWPASAQVDNSRNGLGMGSLQHRLRLIDAIPPENPAGGLGRAVATPPHTAQRQAQVCTFGPTWKRVTKQKSAAIV